MDSNAVKRRLTCILAADAVGYSKLMSEDEENALRVLAAHRAVIDGVIAFHNGRIVNTAGDSVLAEFASAVEAVRCAVEVQDALRTRNEALPAERRMLFRVGVNLGDVVVKGTDLLGDGVNIAARLEGIAEPGGIVISSGIYDQITGKLDLGFQDIGEQNLKNITHPVRAFRVSGSGGTVRLPTPPARKSRGWAPWAVGAGVLVVAGVLAVGKTGWFASPAPPSGPSTAAIDPERARLQAELAAAEKARQEAEIRASTADAAAVRAKAENEAAALRTKAQADAAAVKAKAEAEAAAVRSRSEQEAKAASDRAKIASDANAAKAADAISAKQKAEAEDARAHPEAGPMNVAAASRPAAKFDPSIYDGSWTGSLACDSYEDLAAGTRSIPVAAAGGVFTMDWGEQGSPGGGHAQGRPTGDGSLTLRGTSVARAKHSSGKTIGVRFDGSASGPKFELQGHIGQRNCTLSLARAAH